MSRLHSCQPCLSLNILREGIKLEAWVVHDISWLQLLDLKVPIGDHSWSVLLEIDLSFDIENWDFTVWIDF